MAAAPTELLARRLARARAHMAGAGLDLLLVTHLPNLHYLTGFRATAGAAVLTPDRLTLLADSRYRPSADEAIATLAPVETAAVQPVTRSVDEAAADVIRALGGGRLGFEAAYLPVKRFQWLTTALSGVADPAATDRLVEQERLIKDEFEIGLLREAGRRLSGVVPWVVSLVRPGRTERELAADIDHALARGGFERPAFETIVASGPNGARPHARPTDRPLVPGDLVVLDFGGVYDGYCVDLTRTVCVESPTAELAGLHRAVVEAQAASLGAVRPGVLASSVDQAARAVLARYGLEEAFGHGTGHGLGLEIHEEPRIGRLAPDQADAVIEPGMVFTIEPGVYVPGVGGVRIEDDILVTPEGCELLTDGVRTLELRLA